MKIGVDARCLEWQRGGVARYLLNMLTLWPKLSNDHEYVLYFQNFIPDDEILKQPIYTCRLIQGPTFLKKRRVFAEQLLLPRAIKADNLDLFYATWYTAPLLIPGIKTVVAAWDISYSTHPEHYSFANRISLGWFSKLSTRAAAGTITCSDFDADQIEKYYGIPRQRICTLYLSADDKFSPEHDADRAAEIQQKYGVNEGYLLYMGMIYQRRNVDVLIKAFSEIHDQLPGVQLLVVGRNRTEPFIDLKALIKPLVDKGIASYIEWAPEEDLVDLYRYAKYYTSTSNVDGESIMLKEAMKCGTPVITSRLLANTIGGVGQIIEDPTDVKETGVAILKAFKLDDEGYSVRVRQGLDWTQKFSWEKVAIDSLRFIESR